MSWNAHTDHIVGQCGPAIKKLILCGEKGGTWGESGCCDLKFADDEVTRARLEPTQSLILGGKKYFFLRIIDDDYFGYNKNGEGAAVFFGKQYTAAAIAAEGYKAEQCVDCLEKLRKYMATLNYN